MRHLHWNHLAVLLAAVLSVGCKVFAPALSAPERWGITWHEVAAEHVVLATDIDLAEARELAAEAETTFEALRKVAFRGVSAPRRGLRIVYFSRTEDFTRTTRIPAAGYFAASLFDDPDEEPTIVLRRTGNRKETFTHEIVHALVGRALPFAPTWLDEGLAEYYETIELRDGFAHVGGSPPRGWIERLLASGDDAPSAQALFSMSFLEFHPIGLALPFANESKRTANYLGSWGLAGLLVDDPDHRGWLDRMFDARTVEPGKSVYETAFSGVPAAELEAAYRGYLRSDSHARRAVPYRPGAKPQVTAREMTPAEIRILWARLLYAPCRESDADFAREHLDAALALSPRSAEAWFWKGWLLRQTDDLHGAERSIDVALSLEPDVPRHLLGAVLVADALQKVRQLDERRRRKRDEHLARLSTVARSMGALRRVAEYRLTADDAEGALQLTRRALAAYPRCVMCYFTLADAALLLGKPRTAAFAMERVVAFLGDDAKGARQRLADSYLAKARLVEGNLVPRDPVKELRRRQLQRLLRERRP